MDPHPPLTASKTSGIPRPGSKLPLLRPTSTQLTRPPSPEKTTAPVPQASKRQSVIRPPTHRTNSSVASSQSSLARPCSRAGVPGSPQRQPLGPSSRPQSRHDSAVDQQSFEQHLAAARAKAGRHPSQQENAYELGPSPEESDVSTERSESVAASPVRTARKPPRPSLSDRTVESLSSIPPSPAVSRRRSSFFNTASPMTSSRPSSSSRPESAMGQTTTRQNPSSGSAGEFKRPQSPVKRPGINGSLSTAARRTVSSGLSKVPPVASSIASPHKRVESTPKAPTRPASAIGSPRSMPRPLGASSLAGSKQRPLSTLGPPTRPGNGAQPKAASKPASSVSSTKKAKPTSSSMSSDPLTGGTSTKNALDANKSSASFRAQIAKAKAEHRATSAGRSSESSMTVDFETHEDPFNQGPNGQSTLAKRVDDARRDGRLNIAALDLKQIPDEVVNMYDAEAMEASTVTWSECVDLIRLNAADNALEEIPDNIFLDMTPEELANQFDARGNQFGGLEALDLHGNLLTDIPMGLRRLDRLTKLDLSRNKLDTSIFEVLRYMPGLTELNLSANNLNKDVPESIGTLSSLQVLNLADNKLTSLPGSVRNLVHLRVLNLSTNHFAELPIGAMFSLPNLHEVYAASNALTGAFFPMTVDIVRSLTTLDISNNSLASISFGSELHLPSIQYLNVSRNRLFGMPNLSSWTNLVTLLAEENGLTALPDGFTSLARLKTADLQRNSLRAVEPEVANMTALETLTLAANPLRDKKLLSQSTFEIKETMMKKLEAAKN